MPTLAEIEQQLLASSPTKDEPWVDPAEIALENPPPEPPGDPDEPTFDDSLEGTIARRRNEVDALLAAKLEQGGTFDGNSFELDESSMARLNAAFTIAREVESVGQTWPGMNWTTAANTIYAIADFATFQQMIISLGAQGQALYLKWQEHKLALSALTDIDAVNAYDIALGW